MTPVEWGERCALTLWFTDVPQHCEDGRLLAQLAGGWEVCGMCMRVLRARWRRAAGCVRPCREAGWLASSWACPECMLHSLDSAATRPPTDVPGHLPGAGAPQPPLGLPGSMWLLGDGTDLRLCRLAMAGLALVHHGRLLHSTEGLPESAAEARLQLAVQPDVLRSWLAWKLAPAHGTAAAAAAAAGGGAGAAADAALGAAGAGSAACTLQGPAQLVPGIEFGGVQQAVLALQRWAWRRRPRAWGRERVCSTHLRGEAAGCQQQGAATAQPCSCAWLRSCALQSALQSGEGPGGELLPPGELAAAAVAEAQAQVARQAALDRLLPRWLQLDALFAEDEADGGEPVPV